jgi:hypothetical protein
MKAIIVVGRRGASDRIKEYAWLLVGVAMASVPASPGCAAVTASATEQRK